jgi:hypothetical protein
MHRVLPRRFREEGWLVCPTCGAAHPERFCPTCNMPLIQPAAARDSVSEHVSERRRQARKIKPQLAVGEPVRVARARNQAEAELIAMLLLDEGVPSLVRRTAGADVPDFLAAGPRDVLVPQAGEEVARELLLGAGLAQDGGEPVRVAPGRLLAGLVIAIAVGALIIWLLTLAVHH